MLLSQELCEIYKNVESTNKFDVGYIVGVDEQYFLAESIDVYGKSDGIFCAMTQDIIALKKGTKYLSNLKNLFTYHKQQRYQSLYIKDDVLTNFIEFVKEKHKICTIELCDSNQKDVISYVKCIDNGIVKIQNFNCDGEQDGEAIIDCEMICDISCDSLDDLKVEILSNMQLKT